MSDIPLHEDNERPAKADHCKEGNYNNPKKEHKVELFSNKPCNGFFKSADPDRCNDTKHRKNDNGQNRQTVRLWELLP